MKMTCSFKASDKELELYKEKVKELNGTLDNVTEIIVDGEDEEHVKLTWTTDTDKKIERIRRITG